MEAVWRARRKLVLSPILWRRSGAFPVAIPMSYEPLVRVVCPIPSRKGCRKRTERQGILGLLAILSDEAKRVNRIAEIDVPLFPGYVFCYFDSNARLPILMTPGIVGLSGLATAGAVDDAEIASIRTLALSGRPVQPWPFLRSGQRIRVQAGPLMGAEGIFLRVKDEYHLVVSITLLQRAVSVVIEKDAVAPLFFGQGNAESFQS